MAEGFLCSRTMRSYRFLQQVPEREECILLIGQLRFRIRGTLVGWILAQLKPSHIRKECPRAPKPELLPGEHDKAPAGGESLAGALMVVRERDA